MQKDIIDGEERDKMETCKREILFTTEDIKALPERARAELIDGGIYYMASLGRVHQRMLGYL